jgi:transmembrane sensor
MTERPTQTAANLTPSTAADWVVRLGAPDAGEADWLAFEAWLTAAPGNRQAFDAVQALSMTIDANAEAIAAGLEMSDEPRARRSRFSGRPAMATAAVAAVVLTVLIAPMARNLLAPPPVVYATLKGERRTIQLPDGTRVQLNTSSRIKVQFAGGRREVAMDDAEAAFDVTHDPSRPFVIRVGDQTVQVVGTQFDVSNRQGLVSVTVRRGVVKVWSKTGGDVARLTPGWRLRHRSGVAGAKIEQVTADDAFAWQDGRLICRDEPLVGVVGDLNRYFPRPIRLEGRQLAALRFTGVLTIDDEAQTLQRLSALLRLSATPSGDAIVLRSRADRS